MARGAAQLGLEPAQPFRTLDEPLDFGQDEDGVVSANVRNRDEAVCMPRQPLDVRSGRQTGANVGSVKRQLSREHPLFGSAASCGCQLAREVLP
jgi:hypothetical protein